MREIKFRGKRVDNGEWVEGCLFYANYFNIKNLTLNPCIQVINKETLYHSSYEVIPETVGQFTGLKDKNGKEIYEGDTLLLKDAIFKGFADSGIPDSPNEEYEDFTSEVFFEDGMFCVNEPNTGTSAWVGYNGIKDLEVVGNIHDKKEE